MNPPRKNAAAKAFVGRILPSDIVQNTQYVIRRYQPLPLQMFPILYEKHYRTILDATSLGFDGILGLFNELDYLIQIQRNAKGNTILRLKHIDEDKINQNGYHKDNTLALERLRAITLPNNQFVARMNYNRAIGRIFKQNIDRLWPGALKELLDIPRKDIEIVKSPYERVNLYEPTKARPVIRRLRQILSSYPAGIEISDLGSLIMINKSLFNVASINEFTVEYPEIFYIEEPDEEGGESLVLDGRSNTYKNLKEYNFKYIDDKENENAVDLSKMAMESCVYQKTLILLRAAEPNGLKLSVWEKTFRCNFGPSFNSNEEKLLSLGGLKIFGALFRDGLLEIRSSEECKNDLRIHLPTKPINFDSFM